MTQKKSDFEKWFEQWSILGRLCNKRNKVISLRQLQNSGFTILSPAELAELKAASPPQGQAPLWVALRTQAEEIFSEIDWLVLFGTIEDRVKSQKKYKKIKQRFLSGSGKARE